MIMDHCTESSMKGSTTLHRSISVMSSSTNVRRFLLHVMGLVLIAAIGGVAVACQGQLIGMIDENVGTLESVFITYGGGGLIVGLVMLFLKGGNLSLLQNVPTYTLLSGPLGLVLIAAIGYSVPRLGLVTAFTIIVAAQFIVAAIIISLGSTLLALPTPCG